jgi:hypothetical protein
MSEIPRSLHATARSRRADLDSSPNCCLLLICCDQSSRLSHPKLPPQLHRLHCPPLSPPRSRSPVVRSTAGFRLWGGRGRRHHIISFIMAAVDSASPWSVSHKSITVATSQTSRSWSIPRTLGLSRLLSPAAATAASD